MLEVDLLRPRSRKPPSGSRTLTVRTGAYEPISAVPCGGELQLVQAGLIAVGGLDPADLVVVLVEEDEGTAGLDAEHQPAAAEVDQPLLPWIVTTWKFWVSATMLGGCSIPPSRRWRKSSVRPDRRPRARRRGTRVRTASCRAGTGAGGSKIRPAGTRGCRAVDVRGRRCGELVRVHRGSRCGLCHLEAVAAFGGTLHRDARVDGDGLARARRAAPVRMTRRGRRAGYGSSRCACRCGCPPRSSRPVRPRSPPGRPVHSRAPRTCRRATGNARHQRAQRRLRRGQRGDRGC